MFYSGNPLNPTEYNPVYNLDQSVDLNTLRPIETSVLFGQSVPSGDRTINSIVAPIISGGNLNITGPAPSYIYGPINSQLTLVGGAKFPDGSAANPSITFINDPDTGIYRAGDGTVSFTSNGTNVVNISNNLQVGVPITTPIGQDLVLNPSGTNVNFSGHTIFNAVFPPTGVVPGSYTNTNLTVNAAGFITAASNGSGGGGGSGSRYQVSEMQITAIGAEVTVAYMPWRVASWTGTTTHTYYVWAIPGVLKNLIIRARNNGGPIIGSTVISGGSATGLYSFTITAPVANTKIDLSIEASVGGGPNPKIFGILFEGV